MKRLNETRSACVHALLDAGLPVRPEPYRWLIPAREFTQHVSQHQSRYRRGAESIDTWRARIRHWPAEARAAAD